ncbi:MAG: ion transporter [Nanoarchaeota archaeon]|nr:ion transporter [Nanoarchaeota archaeon]
MIQKVKSRIFEILEASASDFHSRVFVLFIMTLISLNVIAVILETVENLSFQYSYFFTMFEVFSVAVFTIEYLLRIWTCTADKRFENPITGRSRFVVTPLAIVDLIAVLPFYLPLIFPFDLRFIRVLRLFRLFRLLKMARYSESLRTLGNVFKAKKEELFITLFAVLILLIFASSLMYSIEHEAQPQAFSSIPNAMWWGVVTLATVGYGDVYPITPIGKFLGAIISLLGIGMFALPAGIIASGFAEELRRKRRKQICPHCKKSIG